MALTVRVGEEVRAEQLADALWGDDPPASWAKVVPGCVMRLRRALGTRVIETTPAGYRLVVEADSVDACRFERLAGRGRELLAVGEPDRAAHMFGEALSLWRGKALVDVEDWSPARIEASRLDELRLDTEDALLAARLQSGLQREILGEAQARVAEAPLREHRWGLLAQAQYRVGRQGDALMTLRRARAILVNELGLDPGPELAGLEQAILRQDPALMDGAAYSEPSQECPYLGLVPYDVDDADVFFGREDEVASCLRSLAEVGVLTVAGPSGSGKSSLVRAGLAAALRRNGRRVSVIAPGPHPMEALAAVPTPGQHSSALVVDQGEEALVLCDDVDEQTRFLTSLVEYAEHGLVVVAFRADRLGDFSRFPDFARVVERNLHLLSPMTEADLRAVVERPARQAGLLLEPGLVDLLLREVEGEPGALPLLSHALRETWLRREGRTLTVAGYLESGGIRGAVAQSAEQVYEELPMEGRAALRDMLLRLVSPTPDGEPVRNRLPRHLIGTDADHERLIERLVDARLLTSDDGVVELAHEALARAWPRLRSWLDEDVEGQRTFRHLTMSAAGWDSMGRPESELYRGARLARAVGWRDAAAPDLTDLEREFLDASTEREASELQAAQAQLRRERRTGRRLRWLTATVAALGLLAGGAWLVAVDQRQRADERSTEAEARRAGARALVEPSYDRALLLAVEGVHLWDSPETRGNLLNTIQRSPAVAGVIRGEGARLLNLDLSPDGERSVVVDNLEVVTTYDLADRAPVATLGGEGTSYRAATYRPDGSQVAVSWFNTDCWIDDCRRFGISSYDAQNLESTGVTYRGLGAPAADIAYSARGDLIAAIGPLPFYGPDDNVAVWQVDRPDEPMMRLSMSELGGFREVTPDRDVQGWVRFSPDGGRLYAGGAGPTVVFDLATGDRIRSFDGAGALALSPDGKTLAVATGRAGVRLLDTTTGTTTAELSGHEAAVTGAAFSHDGSLIATVSNDQTAIVWDATTGEAVQHLQAHVGSVHTVEFGQDRQLYTAGADGTTIVWDLDRTRGLARQLIAPGRAQSPDEGIPLLSPDATSVLLQGKPRLLDVGTGHTTKLPTDGDSLSWAAYRPDGRQVATVSFDGAVQVWDVETGERVAEAPGGSSENWGAIAYTPDGAHIVVAERNGVVRELDARTLEPTGRALDLDITPVGLRTTHDGLVAVTADSADIGAGTDVVFADLDDARVVHQVHLSSWGVRANFSADGRLYAFGGFNGRVGVIDVATGEEVARTREPIHDGPVSWVTFSPDSETLVSVGFDGRVTMSDATQLVPYVRILPGEPNLRSTAAFADDGHTLVVAYEDDSVVSLGTDPAAWEAHACAVAGRNLTRDEWRDAFPGRAYEATCG